VTLEIEPYRDIVQLTLTQTRLPSAADREVVELGWPTVLANLKTLLETGDVLPTPPWESPCDVRTARMARQGS
jgi:Activator of Hsp90 ATPase homolog 1-like protein